MAQNALTWTIQQLDGSGNTLARRVTTITDTAPTAGDYRGQGSLPDNGAHTITLPTATSVRQFFIKNNHSSANITVTWTPQGGASAVALVIGPGATLGFWDPNTGSSYGITALSLTSSVNAATPYELFLGGS